MEADKKVSVGDFWTEDTKAFGVIVMSFTCFKDNFKYFPKIQSHLVN